MVMLKYFGGSKNYEYENLCMDFKSPYSRTNIYDNMDSKAFYDLENELATLEKGCARYTLIVRVLKYVSANHWVEK